jgi:ribonuclease P protein component
VIREAFRLSKAELPAGIDLIVLPRDSRLTFEAARRSLPILARDVARRLKPPIPITTTKAAL